MLTDLKRGRELTLEIVVAAGIILIALYAGFSDWEHRTHPLHGDMVLTGNAVSNLANDIPYEANGGMQWTDERNFYFYSAWLYFYFASVFWDNSSSYVENLIPSTIASVIFTYLVVYLFIRKYFDRRIALLTILLMSLSSIWYNSMVRTLYGSWASLPGFSVLLYWISIKFLQGGTWRLMVCAGVLTGFAFYYAPWPLIALVAPSVMLMLVIAPSTISFKKRCWGVFLFCSALVLIVLAKEYIFLKTGLRYKHDSSGLRVWRDIFFSGAYQGRGNADAVSSFQFTIPSILGYLLSRGEYMYVFVFKNGLGASKIALFTAIPGLFWMLFQKRPISRILALWLIIIFCVAFLAIKEVSGRYLFPAWPLFYLASAFFIVNIYDFAKRYKVTQYSLILLVSGGITHNAYETEVNYIEGRLHHFATFEYNCFNSIEFPFWELKQFLNKRKTAYDLIVKPTNFNHSQMNNYFRWAPHMIRPVGESYGIQVINYNEFREDIGTHPEKLRQLSKAGGKLLIIANNFNHLVKDNRHCGQYGARIPYDPKALTVSEVRQLMPHAKLVEYAGSIYYPELLALFEVMPTEQSFSGIEAEGLSGGDADTGPVDIKLALSPPVISASSMLDSRFKPEKLFREDSPIWHSANPATLPEWVQVTYGSPVGITRLAIKPQPDSPNGNERDRAPRDFIFQGSNNGSDWDNLLEVKGNLYKKEDSWHEWPIDSKKPYAYYRIYITANGDDQNLVTIHRIRLEIEDDTTTNHSLIRDYKEAITLNRFKVSSISDLTGYIPVSLSVSGSSDGQNWTELGGIGGLRWTQGEAKTFRMTNAHKALRFYKFDFLSGIEKDVFIFQDD